MSEPNPENVQPDETCDMTAEASARAMCSAGHTCVYDSQGVWPGDLCRRADNLRRLLLKEKKKWNPAYMGLFGRSLSTALGRL